MILRAILLALFVFTVSAQASVLKHGSITSLGKKLTAGVMRTAGAGIFSIALACTGLSCGGDDLYNLEHEVGDHLYEEGDRVFFIRGGKPYSGYIRDVDSSHVEVSTFQMSARGTNFFDVPKEAVAKYYYDETLEGKAVVLEGLISDIKYRHGEITHAYTNGYVEITVTHESKFSGKVIQLPYARRVYVHQDASPNEGGYIIDDSQTMPSN